VIADPLFYLAAVPGVLLFGVSKGGFAGGFGIVAVPLMALTVPPAQAAAIMLPILLVMDLGAMWAYRANWDRDLMKVLLPAGLTGTVIGTLTFRLLSASALKLLLGMIAVGFVLYRVTRKSLTGPPAPRSKIKGAFWAAVSGITSFVAHSGGAPMSVYLLPLRLAPAVLVGTNAFIFAALNWSKVLPYWWLGLFSPQNLATAAALAPLGLTGIWLGVWVRKHIAEALFYRIIYSFLFVTGLKLLYDGVRGVAA
jgi:uncharacterized membrane protein YfcA